MLANHKATHAKMSVVEIRILRWMFGKVRKDRIINECVWER